MLLSALLLSGIAAASDLGQSDARVRVDPGGEWVYDGRVVFSASTDNEPAGEFSFRLRYLALARLPSGDTEVAVVAKIEPGLQRRGEKETRIAKYHGAFFLALGPELRARGLRERPPEWVSFWTHHPALPHLEFSPFAATTVPAGPVWSTPWHSFPAPDSCASDLLDGETRVTRTFRSFPVQCGCRERESVLESYSESYRFDAREGVVREAARSWRASSKATAVPMIDPVSGAVVAQGEMPAKTQQVELSLRLVEGRRLSAAELDDRRREAQMIREVAESLARLDGDPGEMEASVGDLEDRLSDSPLLAAVVDLRRVIEVQSTAGSSMRDAIRLQNQLLDRPAPDFTGRDLAGKEVALSGLRGKVVLLNFWSSACGACAEEAPALNAAADHFGKRGLVVVGLNGEEDRERESEFAREVGYRFPVLLGMREAVRRYRAESLPCNVVVDRSGILRFRFVGFAQEQERILTEAVERWLKEGEAAGR